MKTPTLPIPDFRSGVLILSAALAPLVTHSQAVSKKVDLKNFHSCDIGTAVVANISYGAIHDITVKAAQEDMDKIRVTVTSGILTVRTGETAKVKNDVTVDIVMPAVKQVIFSGAASGTLSGFTGKYFKGKFSGASQCTINANFDSVLVSAGGASKITMTGKGVFLDADISGASELSAYGYEFSAADVTAAGASEVKCTVTGLLTGTASGASEVRYKGKPSKVEVETSGASTVKKEE